MKSQPPHYTPLDFTSRQILMTYDATTQVKLDHLLLFPKDFARFKVSLVSKTEEKVISLPLRETFHLLS